MERDEITPCVSVIMSVYNGERFLREAVESVLNQTFADFEFIIINDASTDNSWQILTQYATQDARIVLIRNEVNRGVAYSANKGLARARGKYIARMDADDMTIPERLARQVHFLETHPEVGVLGGYLQRIDSHGHRHSRLWQRPTEHGLLRWRLCFENPMANQTVLMRREVVARVNGYRPEFESFSEDYDLWQRLSGRTRLANLPEVFTYQRRDDGYDSNVSSQHEDRQYQNSLEISQRMMSEILGEEVPLRLVKYLIKHFGTPKFETSDDVSQTARLIYRLCRVYVIDPTLSRAEEQLVRNDAARELYRLFRLHLYDLRAWPILGWACRLDSSVVGNVISGKARRMMPNLPMFLERL